MLEDPFSPLSFIAGPAILANACAILQNGATTRYSLAITQWRDFRVSVAAGDDRLEQQYLDPDAALALAERRVRLQLRSLGLLNAAAALFAATAVLSLGGAFLVQAGIVRAAPVVSAMMSAGGIALLFLLASTMTFFREGACSRALLMLHRSSRERSDAGQNRRIVSSHAA
jgi:hypothetical protein